MPQWYVSSAPEPSVIERHQPAEEKVAADI
jgi:hypothetical protein